MYKKTILASFLMSMSISVFSQDKEPGEIQLPEKEYYYCFALFEDTIFHTEVFGFDYGTDSKYQAIQEGWESYVKVGMGLEQHIPIVVGPYTSYESIITGRSDWMGSQPDSVRFVPVDFRPEGYRQE